MGNQLLLTCLVSRSLDWLSSVKAKGSCPARDHLVVLCQHPWGTKVLARLQVHAAM